MLHSIENILLVLGNAIIGNIFITGIIYLLILIWQNLFKKNSLPAGFIFGVIVFLFVQFLFSAAGFSIFTRIDFKFLALGKNPFSYYALCGVSILYIVFLIPKLFAFLQANLLTTKSRKYKSEKHFAHLKLFVEQSQQILNISKKVKLIVTRYAQQAFTFGVLKPVIVLPFSIITQLDQHQIEAIILHELSHIKQNDYFKNYWIQIIKSILYFNPFIHYLAEEFSLNCEKNADKTVTDFEYNKKEYTSALLLLAQSKNNLLTLHASKKQPQLLQRIKIIFGDNKKEPTPVLKPLFQFSITFILFISILTIQFKVPVSQGYSAHTPYQIHNQIDDVFSSLTPAQEFSSTEINNKTKPSFEKSIVENKTKITVPKKHKAAETKFIAPEIVLNVEEKPTVNEDLHFSSLVDSDKSNTEKIEQSVAFAKNVIFELYWTNLENTLAESVTSSEKNIIQNILHVKLDEQAARLKEKILKSPETVNWSEFRNNLLQSLYSLNIEKAYNNSLLALVKINSQIEKESNTTSDTLYTLIAQKQEIKKFIQAVDSVKNQKVKNL